MIATFTNTILRNFLDAPGIKLISVGLMVAFLVALVKTYVAAHDRDSLGVLAFGGAAILFIAAFLTLNAGVFGVW